MVRLYWGKTVLLLLKSIKLLQLCLHPPRSVQQQVVRNGFTGYENSLTLKHNGQHIPVPEAVPEFTSTIDHSIDRTIDWTIGWTIDSMIHGFPIVP